MKLLLIVLNKIDLLDPLLEELSGKDIRGATILSSTGMAKELAKFYEDLPIFGSLRFKVDFDRKESKTIFMVLKDEQIEAAKEAVRGIIGDISKPDTAVMFTLPVLSAEGVEF